MVVVTSSRRRLTPAKIYDQRFVLAFFAQWGPVAAAKAGVGPGMEALDFGCGTGALSRAASGLVGARGEVVGLYPNPYMLAVASMTPSATCWELGRAEALPFEDAPLDAVVRQFAMMFFDVRAAALRESGQGRSAWSAYRGRGLRRCRRVARLCVVRRVFVRLFGPEIDEAFRTPFVLGHAELLARIAGGAGVEDAVVDTRVGSVRFASIHDLVSTERACAWTLGGLLDSNQFDCLFECPQTEISPFLTSGGAVEFPMLVLLLSYS